MHFGYPGENTHLENHGVSEESFWPSFTDIMMVIVMVFLLVTVAVILNNWSLIADLKNSIKAQQVASSLAENRQEQNDSLASKLSFLERQVVMLVEKYEEEKTSLAETQQILSDNKKQLLEKENSLSSLEKQLLTLNETREKDKLTLLASQQAISDAEEKLIQKDSALGSLQASLDNTLKEKDELASLNASQTNKIDESLKAQQALQETIKTSKATLTALQKEQEVKGKEITQLQENLKEKETLVSLNKTQKSKIEESQKAQQALQKDLEKNKSIIVTLEKAQKDKDKSITQLKEDAKQKITILTSLQSESSKMEEKLSILQADHKKVTESLKAETSTSKETQSELKTLRESQTALIDKFESAEKALQDAEDEKHKLVVEMNQKLVESEEKTKTLELSVEQFSNKLEAKDKEVLALKSEQDSGHSQLRSLQGEYDTLDSKYQKLLLPARSSKGKFVVSVSYKKKGGKRLIRLKSSPTGSYKTVNKKELNKTLTALKSKHKTDLYLKVIIPNNSGLSYNEAWKFTNNLQRKYDYYNQKN